MKTNVCKMKVEDVKSNEFGSAEVHLISEIDFEHMNPLELLQSGGSKKSVIFLKNLGDEKMIENVKKKLQNQVISVCEYRFEVGELFDGKTTVTQTITDDEGEQTKNVFSQLVQSVPCTDDFQPTESDIENIKATMIAQTKRRIETGTYELKQSVEVLRSLNLFTSFRNQCYICHSHREFYINIQPFNRILHKIPHKSQVGIIHSDRLTVWVEVSLSTNKQNKLGQYVYAHKHTGVESWQLERQHSICETKKHNQYGNK